MNILRLIVGLHILISFQQVIAQESIRSDSGIIYLIEPKVGTGTIINNNEKAALLVKDKPWLVQVDFSVLKNMKHVWDYNNCYIQNGFSLSYINYGNPDYLGNAYTFSAFTEPHIIHTGRFQFTLRGSAGFAYLNKLYDKQYDSNNLFYSKRISYILSIGTAVKYKVSKFTAVSLSAQFNHISNGGSKWPNWGMNSPFISLGVSHALQSTDNLTRRTKEPFKDASWKIIMHVFGGVNTIDARDSFPEEKKLVTGINTGIVRMLGKSGGIGIGGEFYYDGVAHIQEQRTKKEFTPGIGSLSIQHYLTLGRLLLGEQLAYYVTRTNPDVKTRLYQRYFIEYRISGPLYAGVSLKAHGNVSDFLALSAGYIFSTQSSK